MERHRLYSQPMPFFSLLRLPCHYLLPLKRLTSTSDDDHDGHGVNDSDGRDGGRSCDDVRLDGDDDGHSDVCCDFCACVTAYASVYAGALPYVGYGQHERHNWDGRCLS